MATHDYVLDNATGANFRSDLNNALAAIVSNNSSSSEPSTKYAYQWWADTNEGVLKIRNSSNDGWVTLLQLDGTLTLEDGTNSAPALGFRDDLNTGIFSSAADTLDITCGGTTRGSFSSSGLTVTGNVTATTFVGNIDAVDGDFDGTLEADAITVAGTALSSVIEGSTLTQAAQTNITSLGTLTGLTVSGTTEFTANVKFDGDTAGRDITFLRSSNKLRFQDNATFSLGDDDDFSAFHDGSKTRFINDTGNLELQSDNYIFRDKDNGDLMMKLLHDAAVELYYDHSKKAETTSLGLQLTDAHIFLNDNYYVSYGTGGDLKIYHNGTKTVIDNNTGNLQIDTTANEVHNVQSEFQVKVKGGDEDGLKVVTDGAVELYHNNHKSFQTSTHGAQFFAPEGGTCQVFLYADEGDDNADLWGFQASHTASEFKLINYASGSYEDSIVADGNGAVELYHDNSKKLETTSSGINVTGAITVNGSALATGGGKILQVKQGELNGTFSSTSTSFVNIGLSEAITPSSTSSKILVIAMLNFGSDNNGNRLIIRLVRTGDDNILVGNASGSRTRGSAQYATTDDGDMNNVNLTHLDSPSTTSSVTYQVQCKVQSSSGTIKFGASGGDGNSSIEARTPQRIVLLEVGP